MAQYVYRGSRTANGTVVTVMLVHQPESMLIGEFQVLDWRLDIANHSPTGLEWGYAGSGPAQLAIAILAHHFQVPKPAPKGWDSFSSKDTAADRLVQRVYALHQPFKFKAIAPLDRESDTIWKMTTADVQRVIDEIEMEQATSIRRPTIGGDVHESR